MPLFHPLTVTGLHRTIRDAVVLTLSPQSGDFSFVQGQYLTFRREFDGVELRRSYSICAGRDDGELRVAIKRVAGGNFSNWANDNLQVGDTLQAMQPMGNFHAPLIPDAKNHYLLIAGGSGITPILSILKTTLSAEPDSVFTLLYANRSVASIMFREGLEDLKNLHMARLNIIHVLEDDTQGIDLFTGRIDTKKCAALFDSWINVASIDMVFICGPEPMMLGIKQSLLDHRLAANRIKYELFASDQIGKVPKMAVSAQMPTTGDVTATVTVNGTTRIFQMPASGQTLLEAALQNDLDAPYSCRAGVCATCKAKVLQGEVEMHTNHALEDYEVEQGYVLTCQCTPISKQIVLDYQG